MPSPSSEMVVSPYRVVCNTCKETDLKVSTLIVHKEKVSVNLILEVWVFFIRQIFFFLILNIRVNLYKDTNNTYMMHFYRIIKNDH